MFADGGIARLKVYGVGQRDWSTVTSAEEVDLVALVNGGVCLGYTDAHFGHPRNMIGKLIDIFVNEYVFDVVFFYYTSLWISVVNGECLFCSFPKGNLFSFAIISISSTCPDLPHLVPDHCAHITCCMLHE